MESLIPKFDVIIPLAAIVGAPACNDNKILSNIDLNLFSSIRGYNKIEKICLFLDFTVEFKNQDVPDPYYGKLEDFEKTFELIKIGAEAIVEKFK